VHGTTAEGVFARANCNPGAKALTKDGGKNNDKFAKKKVVLLLRLCLERRNDTSTIKSQQVSQNGIVNGRR
jgi:hypothetical protein